MARSAQGKADIIYGAATVLMGAALFAHTFSDQYSNEFLFGDVSTVFVPRVLLAMIVLLSLALVLKGARDQRGGDLPKIDVHRTARVFGTCVLSIAGVWFIGYLIAMPVGVFLIGWAIGYPNKIVLAATAVVAPILTWYILGQAAQVSFPAGTLF